MEVISQISGRTGDILAEFMPFSMDNDDPSRHLWLRAHLNKTLAEVYTTEQAYCHPNDIQELVTTQDRGLVKWYHQLPLRDQFPRDVSGMRSSQASGATFSHSLLLAFRYYNCSYMLHRPILYFLAHENMERSVSGLGMNAEHAPRDQASTFRLFEACRQCLQSATLLLLTAVELWGPDTKTTPTTPGITARSSFNYGWIEIQT